MKNGNWIPISKNFINDLPKDRPYTKLEAAYCLQLDYDNNNEVTVSGCSDLWQWSRKKVYLFLDQMGIEIIYPEITQKIKNQRGHIGLHKRDIKGTYKGHIRLIDFSTLQTEKNIRGTYKGHKRDIKGSTTIDPISSILNPKDKTFLSDSIEYRLAEYLFNHILKNNPKHKPVNIQSWAKSIDLMLRVDNREVEEIKQVIRWCQQDEFWRTNILSASKLREQYDALILKMNNKKGEPQTIIKQYINEATDVMG